MPVHRNPHHPFWIWLEHSGYTAQSLATKLGVTRSAVYGWASGTYTPSTQHLATLMKLSQGAVQPYFWLEASPPTGPASAGVNEQQGGQHGTH